MSNEKLINEKTWYVCTKLSIMSKNRDDYFNEEYSECACDGLNTGEEKSIFLTKESAEMLLKKKGNTWGIYEMNLPITACKVNTSTGNVELNPKFTFEPQHLKDIHFLSYEPNKPTLKIK